MADQYVYDLTNEAEDIDKVLQDLVKILKDTNNSNTAVLAEISGNERRFKLGRSSSGEITDIPGEDDQIVVADGEGNAKANLGKVFIKFSDSIPSLDTIYSAIELNANGTQDAEIYWDQETPHKAKFHMDGASLFRMNKTDSSPVVSMTGGAVLDFFGGTSSQSSDISARDFKTNEQDWRSESTSQFYKEVASPFVPGARMDTDGKIYPLIQFKQSPTIIFEDQPLVHIAGGGSLLMDGNIDVRLRTSGSASNVNGKQFLKGFGPSHFWIEGGGIFEMSVRPKNDGTPSSQYGPLFLMKVNDESEYRNVIPSQIILSNERKLNDPDFKVKLGSGVLNLNAVDGSPPVHLVTLFSSDNKGFVRHKLAPKFLTPSLSSWLSSVVGPTFAILGKSKIIIGDEGTLGIRLATEGELAVDATCKGYVGLKLGNNGTLAIDSSNDGKLAIKLGNKGESVIGFEPNGDTSLKFSPEELCGISFTPKNTDLCYQWDSFDGAFDGGDNFLWQTGNTHYEFLDGATIILRGNKTIATKEGKRVKHSSGPSITIVTSTDYTGKNVDELNTQDREEYDYKLEKTSAFSAQRIYYIDGGKIVSTECYTDKYAIGIEGFTQTYSGTGDDCFTFESNIYYSNYSQLASAQEYTDYLNTTFGSNSTVSSGSIVTQQWQMGRRYLYKIKGTVSNILKTCNLETNYSIGTPFTDLSTEDREKYNASSSDQTNAKVVSNGIRADMKYNTVISGYNYYQGTHLGLDWLPPVQSTEHPDAPIFQMYNQSNICMRRKEQYALQYKNYSLPNPSVTYDFTRPQHEIIAQFKAGADYATFLAGVSIDTGYEIDDIDYLSLFGLDSVLQVGYAIKPSGVDNYVISTREDPVLEMTGSSELRLHNGASIIAETKYNETLITIRGTASSNDKVTFSMDDLKTLYNLIHP